MTETNICEILLIDDDTDDIVLFQEAMKLIRPAANPVCVANCGEGIKSMYSTKPDVLFIDVVMYGTNGIDCIKLIKQDPVLTDIPVVVLASNFNPAKMDLLYDLGVSYFVTKPPSFIKLQSILNNLVNTPKLTAKRTRESFHFQDFD